MLRIGVLWIKREDGGRRPPTPLPVKNGEREPSCVRLACLIYSGESLGSPSPHSRVAPAPRLMTRSTPHQDSALKAGAVGRKAKRGKKDTPQVFRLSGYAGTGKTTL